MKPLIKWLLLGLAALLVLGVAVVVAVVILVDPARYRTAIVDAVQQSTGRVLSVGGEVELKLLPCCAVELQQVAIGNPPGFPAEPFLSVKSAQLAIRLWPLLVRREVEIGTVSIDGLRANLIGRKDGTNNWSFNKLAEDARALDSTSAAPGVTSFNVAGISVRDASLNYSDEANGNRYRVEQLQLTTGAVRERKPFDLSAAFRLTDLADNSGLSVRLTAQTRVELVGDVTTVRLARVDAGLDTIGLAGLDTLTGSLQAPGVDVRIANDTVVDVPELTADLQLKGADLPGGSAPLAVTLTGLRYSLDAGAGSVSALTAKTNLAGAPLDAEGAGSFGTSDDLRGTLRFPGFSPREILPNLKREVPDTADQAALKQLSGSASWYLRDEVAGLENLAVVLDDTKISGSLALERPPEGSDATPKTLFDLTIDALDADRYLPPDKVLPPIAGDGKPREAATEIPVETLRALNLEGRARFGRLTINKLQLVDVDVTTSAQAGRVRLEPLAATLYGGTFRGGMRLDATGLRTRVSLDQSFGSVNIGALLTDLADIRNITGTMNLKLDGAADGTTNDELLENLGGSLSFSLVDGVYKGMDVWYEIRRANALLRRKAPPARTGPRETPIRTLDLAGKITKGELRTDRFDAEIPFLQVSGTATVNLPNSTLDSNLTALVFEKPVFPGDDSLQELENVRIPLTVSGPIASPKVKVDLSRMVKDGLKDSVRETLEDKLRKKLGLDEPAEPAEGESPPEESKKDDPLKKALDRLFR